MKPGEKINWSSLVLLGSGVSLIVNVAYWEQFWFSPLILALGIIFVAASGYFAGTKGERARIYDERMRGR